MNVLRVLASIGLVSTLVTTPSLAAELVQPERGFAVTPPEGWETTEVPTGSRFDLNAHPPGSSTTVLTVKVIPVPGIADDAAFRVALLAGERAKPEHERIAEIEVRLAGAMRAGIDVDTRSNGTLFRVRQAYVVRDGQAYLVQAYTPVDSYEDRAETIDGWFRSFRLIEPTGEAAEEQRLRRIAARCGQELGWAATWEEAAARARAEKKLVLAYARFQPGFDISDSTMSGPFHDPAIVALVQHRFVPVRLTKEGRTPLHERDVYGLSGSSFGVSILLCRPDGEVVREGFAAETTAVWELLVDALARAPEAVGVSAPSGTMPAVERAKVYVDRGELEDALAALTPLSALEDRGGPDAIRVRARVYELQRRGHEAVKLLMGLLNDLDHVDVRIDGGRLLLRRGEGARGLTGLARFESHEHPRQPEALYLLGEAYRLEGRSDDAAAVWRRVVDEHEESRWAAKAAAALTTTGASLGAGERQSWPEERLLDALRPVPYEPLAAGELHRAEQDAVRYLVANQRDDGSWIMPMEIGTRGESEFANPFVVAVTAIAVRGLLPHRSDSAVARAVDDGIAFLADARARERAKPTPVLYMDYTVWSRAYEIFALADALERGVIDGESTIPALDELVEGLGRRQQTNGGWSYYVSGELGGTPVEQSISFVTAAVTAALLRAREVGADVPDEMTGRALDALDAMRNANRTFEYFLFQGAAAGARATGLPGAAGRSPVCELARLRGGRGDPAALRGAVNLWLDHQAPLAAEAGKALMHSGDDGQGCHYILFDYSTIAEAIALLPREQQGQYRTALLRRLLDVRTADGGYLDSPFLGRAYGAGMALLVYRWVGVTREF